MDRILTKEADTESSTELAWIYSTVVLAGVYIF